MILHKITNIWCKSLSYIFQNVCGQKVVYTRQTQIKLIHFNQFFKISRVILYYVQLFFLSYLVMNHDLNRKEKQTLLILISKDL